MGIVIAGLGIVAIVAPPLLTIVIHGHGWRGGYFALAATVGVLGALSLWLIGPPHLGQVGQQVAEAPTPPSRTAAGGAFWLLLAVFAIGSIFSTGYMVHLVAILKQRGMSDLGASGIASLAGIGLLAGRVLSGWLMDRIFAPRVGSAIFVGFAIALALLATGSQTMLLPAVLLMGVCLGSELDILGYLVSRYFPIGSFGKVYSVIYSATFIVGGFSPLLIARLSRQGADYTTAFWCSCAALALVAVLLLFAPPFPVELAPAGRRREADEHD